ncbi:hypothetical protein [Nautilia sp.]
MIYILFIIGSFILKMIIDYFSTPKSSPDDIIQLIRKIKTSTKQNESNFKEENKIFSNKSTFQHQNTALKQKGDQYEKYIGKILNKKTDL